MGFGKTAVILCLIQELDLQDVLIVAPLTVAREVWAAEANKWDRFAGLEVVPLMGGGELTPDKARAVRVKNLLAPPRIATVNYEQLPWLRAQFGDDWPWSTVVCDESTRLAGFRIRLGTKRSKAIGMVAHTAVKRWVNLSGTPSPNGLEQLWGQHWYIDGGAALGKSYQAFKDRWFYHAPTRGGLFRELKPFEHAEGQILERMRDKSLSLQTKDWFDIAAPIEREVWFDLPTDARAAYKTMARQFYAELERGLVTAANAAVKVGKLLQVSSGAVYHVDGAYSWVHDAKITALKSLVEESSGTNLFVVYQYRSELTRLKKAFLRAVEVHEPNAIRDWNKGEIRMLLAHPRSAGHGLNLQDGGHHIVYFTPTFDAELYAQVLERIGPVRQKQSGYDRPVYVHHLLARHTLDAAVKADRESKADLMDRVMEALKRLAL